VRHPGSASQEISYHSLDGAKSKGPSMSIKFEGKAPASKGDRKIAASIGSAKQYRM
jgi:hypothetical protein